MVAPILTHSMGRGWRIFEKLLPAIDASFADQFKTATGLTTEDYYVCWSTCVANFLMKKSEATIFDSNTLGGNTIQPTLVRSFVDLESQTLTELRQALWGNTCVDEILANPLRLYDYRPMREKPLLRPSDGRTIILDPIFVIDKTAIGPLFHALKPCDHAKGNHLFVVFGMAFERYIQETLRRAFPKPATYLFDPLSCSVKGQSRSGDFEVDACLNYVTDLILFELKATWPREGELTPDNSLSLLQSLRKQYGISEHNKKGAAQLARVVKAITEDKWPGPAKEFRQVKRIVPVLVVHDVLLGAPGFGAFVAAEFDRALGPSARVTTGERPADAVRVVVPIVLTVEDLELLEVSIDHFSLRDALLDYSDACPDRMTSFHSFLAASPDDSRQIYANRDLAAAAMEPLSMAMDRLFGHSLVE